MTHKQLFLLITFLLAGGGVWGQVELVLDNFGSTAQDPINRVGWTADNGSGSDWELRTTSASSGYSWSNPSISASGGANVFTNLGTNNNEKTLTYDNGISTIGYNTIKVRFGAVKQGTVPDLNLYYSVDGVSFSLAGGITLPTSWNDFTIDLPSQAEGVANLIIRFSIIANSGSSNNFRIDDFHVIGIVNCTPPTTQATNFGSDDIEINQMDVTWTKGNGANILVVAREGGAVDADPVNGTTYSADAAFGSGDEIGTGNYVVYNGPGSMETVTSLTLNTTYHYALYEFDGSGGSECYRTSDKLTGNAKTLAFAHDNCAGAIALTVDADEICDGATNGTSIDGTQSIAGVPCGGFTGDADDDVWYSFVATYTTHIITVDGAANMDAVIDLRSGACNGTNIDCADATTADGVEVITNTGLTIGNTYYVRIYDYDAGGGDFTICVTTPSQPLHYRSKASGNFSSSKAWEKSTDNMNWSNATKAPDVNDLSVTIQSGHTITVSSTVTIDQLTVESGGTLDITGGTLIIADGSGDDLTVAGTLKNGSSIASSGSIVITSVGTYQHNVSGSAGTIPNATWNSGSTCEILQAGGTGRPNGLGQNFHHFTWNFTTQSTEADLNGELDNIAGDFHIMHTGSSNVRMVGSTNTTTVGGDLTIDGTATLNLSGSSGNGIIQVSGDCTINGTLTETGSSDNSRLEFVGSGSGTLSMSGSITGSVNIVLNRTGVSGDITLNSDLTLGSDAVLTLTDGLLHTGSNKVILMNTATESISGGSSASYIDGNLQQHISTTSYVWPLGEGIVYAPVSLGILSSGALYLDAKYDPTGFTLDEGESTCTDPPVTDYTYENNCGSWEIMPNTSGSESYNITLVDAAGCGATTFTIAKDGVIPDCPTGLSASFTSWSRFDLLGGPAGVLPVELTHFHATRVDQKVKLNWATASEINNDYFLVQHSTDGIRFDDLGTVIGAGTTTQSQTYQWMHEQPSPGENYYRLKQVDYNGQFEYSPIRAVMMDGEGTAGSWIIRPTVTSDMIYLIRSGQESDNADWTILTPDGRAVMRGAIQKGAEQTPLSVAALTGGMYILRVSNRDGVWTGRFQKD